MSRIIRCHFTGVPHVSERGRHSSRHDRSPMLLAGCPPFRSQNVEVVWQNLQEAIAYNAKHARSVIIYLELIAGGALRRLLIMS